jgi:hypothetical protein
LKKKDIHLVRDIALHHRPCPALSAAEIVLRLPPSYSLAAVDTVQLEASSFVVVVVVVVVAAAADAAVDSVWE